MVTWLGKNFPPAKNIWLYGGNENACEVFSHASIAWHFIAWPVPYDSLTFDRVMFL